VLVRHFEFSRLPPELRELILAKDPIEADIGIFEGEELKAVLIPPDLHRWLEEQIEAKEDEIDSQAVRDFQEKK
jgi:hypothetical protein